MSNQFELTTSSPSPDLNNLLKEENKSRIKNEGRGYCGFHALAAICHDVFLNADETQIKYMQGSDSWQMFIFFWNEIFKKGHDFHLGSENYGIFDLQKLFKQYETQDSTISLKQRSLLYGKGDYENSPVSCVLAMMQAQRKADEFARGREEPLENEESSGNSQEIQNALFALVKLDKSKSTFAENPQINAFTRKHPGLFCFSSKNDPIARIEKYKKVTTWEETSNLTLLALSLGIGFNIYLTANNPPEVINFYSTELYLKNPTLLIFNAAVQQSDNHYQAINLGVSSVSPFFSKEEGFTFEFDKVGSVLYPGETDKAVYFTDGKPHFPSRLHHIIDPIAASLENNNGIEQVIKSGLSAHVILELLIIKKNENLHLPLHEQNSIENLIADLKNSIKCLFSCSDELIKNKANIEAEDLKMYKVSLIYALWEYSHSEELEENTSLKEMLQDLEGIILAGLTKDEKECLEEIFQDNKEFKEFINITGMVSTISKQGDIRVHPANASEAISLATVKKILGDKTQMLDTQFSLSSSTPLSLNQTSVSKKSLPSRFNKAKKEKEQPTASISISEPFVRFSKESDGTSVKCPNEICFVTTLDIANKGNSEKIVEAYMNTLMQQATDLDKEGLMVTYTLPSLGMTANYTKPADKEGKSPPFTFNSGELPDEFNSESENSIIKVPKIDNSVLLQMQEFLQKMNSYFYEYVTLLESEEKTSFKRAIHFNVEELEESVKKYLNLLNYEALPNNPKKDDIEAVKEKVAQDLGGNKAQAIEKLEKLKANIEQFKKNIKLEQDLGRRPSNN